MLQFVSEIELKLRNVYLVRRQRMDVIYYQILFRNFCMDLINVIFFRRCFVIKCCRMSIRSFLQYMYADILISELNFQM